MDKRKIWMRGKDVFGDGKGKHNTEIKNGEPNQGQNELR